MRGCFGMVLFSSIEMQLLLVAQTLIIALAILVLWRLSQNKHQR